MGASRDAANAGKAWYDHGTDIVTAYPIFISAWIWINNNAFDIMSSIGKGSANNDLSIYNSNGTIYLRNTLNTFTFFSSTVSPSTGEWNHYIVASRSTTDHEIYVNGVSKATSSSDAGTFTGTVDTLSPMGQARDASTSYFDGKTAYVMFGTDSMTDEMAMEIYNDPTYMPPGVLGYYQLTEEGTTASDMKDISGNGYHLNTSRDTVPTASEEGPPISFPNGSLTI